MDILECSIYNFLFRLSFFFRYREACKFAAKLIKIKQ